MPSLDPDIYRNLLDALPVGIYIVGLDRRIQFWNKAAEHITGHLAHEVIGRSCGGVLVHCATDGSQVCCSGNCLLACALRDRQPRETLLFSRHKDGHSVPLLVRSIPLCSDDGKVHAIAETFQQHGASPSMQVPGVGPDPNDGLNIPSLSATEAYVQSRMQSPGTTAIFILELERVQDIARRHGKEMVNASMRALVHTAGDLLPMPHFLGRWRDHTFLILVPNATDQMFRELLGQLRGIGNSLTVLWWGDRVASNANVRGALVRDAEQLRQLISPGEQS